MKTVQIIIDIVALIVFSVGAIKGIMISPWYVVAWIIVAMMGHLQKEGRK